MNQKIFDVSWVSLWRILLMLIFGVVLYLLFDVLVILFLALIISSALDAPISFMEKRKIPRILGAIIIFLTTAAVLGVLLYTIIPAAVFEFNSLYNSVLRNYFNIPYLESLETFSSLPSINKLESSLENFVGVFLKGASSSLVSVVGAIFGGVISVIAVFILSFYLAVSKYGVEKFLRFVLPIRYEGYVLEIYDRTKSKIGLWLQGQLILSLIIGILVFLGLLFLGVKYSLIFGILAGILEMVPFVGPVLVGTLAALIGFSESFTLGISVIALFIVIQQLENHLLVPLVMKYTVGLHPVVVVISLLAGVKLAGFVGILLAIPIAVIVVEILESWANRRKMEKESQLF